MAKIGSSLVISATLIIARLLIDLSQHILTQGGDNACLVTQILKQHIIVKALIMNNATRPLFVELQLKLTFPHIFKVSRHGK